MRFCSAEQNAILNRWKDPGFRMQMAVAWEPYLWKDIDLFPPERPGRYLCCFHPEPEELFEPDTITFGHWDGTQWNVDCTHWRELLRGPAERESE